VSSGLVIRSGCPRLISRGVVFSKLSILLNQENALSAPWSRESLPSADAPSRGAGVLRTGVIRHFDVPLLFAITQVIMQGSAEAFLVVGGRCTGRAHRCKAKQGRRGKTALMSYSYYYSSMVFGRRREGKKISLVTM
jgi:hypothetical protein